MTLRVVHVTRDFPPRSCGGISTAVHGLVEASAATGRVSSPILVVSFDAWRPRARSGGERAPATEVQGPASVLRVHGEADLEAARAFVRAATPDVVHVHDGMLWEFAVSCGPARRVFTPHVVHRALNELRGIDELTLSLQGQERALAEADVVVAPSAAAARMLDRPATVAPLGFALPPVPAPSKPGPPVLLHVGRFDAAKGTDDLLDIIARVLAAVPGARCEIAGGIPENPKAERRRRRHIEARFTPDLRERVALLGWLDGPELEAAYARAHVLLQPSRLETVGLSVLEGMGRGLAVVATRCGGPEGLIVDGRTGRLLEVRDVAGMAEAAIALLRDDARRGAMGRAAVEASATWAWPRVVDRWLDTYLPGAARRARVRMTWSPPAGPLPAGDGEEPDLRPGPEETLDHLGGEWRIFQRARGHRWSTDDLAVAWFACSLATQQAPLDAPRRILDLGAGIGSIALLCAWRLPTARIVGVEAQAQSGAMFARSVRWNGAEDRIDVRCGDLRDPGAIPEDAAFDLVTANPPYVDPGLGAASPIPQRENARIAHRGGAGDYFEAAARSLAPEGLFVMVHHDDAAERLDTLATSHRLVPHRRRTVVFRDGRRGRRPVIALYAWRREGTAGRFQEDPPLLIRDESGERSPEWRAARQWMGLPP